MTSGNSTYDEIINNLTKQLSRIETSSNHFFLILSGILVSLMQAGFALVEAGSVHPKDVTNIMLKNILDTLVSCVVYWLLGYSLAFSDGNAFIGYSWWAGYNMPEYRWSEWFYQFIYASTASTVISGAVAGRCTLIAYFVYSTVMSGIIYPIVSHWCWTNEGWLHKFGYRDFAGSGVVHVLAGSASLVASILIGPRIGRFKSSDTNDSSFKETVSPLLIGTGVLLLITGFTGFNAGSLGHITHENDGPLVARIICSTIMSGACGAIVVTLVCQLGFMGDKSSNILHIANGAITGMISSCAGCDIFSMLESLITGTVSGIFYIGFHHLLVFFKIDDPVDACPVHLGGGLWGVIAAPLISHGSFLFNDYVNVLENISVNGIGGLSIILWSTLTSIFLFGFLKFFGLLRVTVEQEILGVQFSRQDEGFYSADAISSRKNQVAVISRHANGIPMQEVTTEQ